MGSSVVYNGLGGGTSSTRIKKGFMVRTPKTFICFSSISASFFFSSRAIFQPPTFALAASLQLHHHSGKQMVSSGTPGLVALGCWLQPARQERQQPWLILNPAAWLPAERTHTIRRHALLGAWRGRPPARAADCLFLLSSEQQDLILACWLTRLVRATCANRRIHLAPLNL